MSEFPLRWRFDDRKHRVLPRADLDQIKPLDAVSARKLFHDAAQRWRIMPPDLKLEPAHVDRTSIEIRDDGDHARVRDWLLGRGVAGEAPVLVSWDQRAAVTTTWSLVARYWDAFWYPSSDDLLVFDASARWFLFMWHEEEAFFVRAA